MKFSELRDRLNETWDKKTQEKMQYRVLHGLTPEERTDMYRTNGVYVRNPQFFKNPKQKRWVPLLIGCPKGLRRVLRNKYHYLNNDHTD